MTPRSRRVLCWVALGLTVAAMGLWQASRPRPPRAPPVGSQPTSNREETARLEDGFTWNAWREGRRLFELLGQTLIGYQGGANLVEGVKKLTLYTEDGRPVVIEAGRARIRQSGPSDTDMEVSLEDDVKVRAPDGVLLETQRLIFDTVSKRLLSPGPSTLSGPEIRAHLASFEYSVDGRVVESEGPVEAELGQGRAWHVDAGRLRHHLASGELVFYSPFRARRPEGTLIGGRGDIVLPAASLASKSTIEGPVIATGVSRTAEWQFAATRASGRGLLPGDRAMRSRQLEAGPATSLTVVQDQPGAMGHGELRAETWQVEQNADEPAVKAVGGPGFSGRWTGSGADQTMTLSGDWLEVQRSAQGAVESVLAKGRVTAAGPNGATLEGRALLWEAARPAQIVLTGDGSRAKQGADLVESPRLTVFRDQKMLVADQNPITEVGSLRKTDGSLFRGDEPVRVRSSRASISEGAGPIEFEGPVQAWQQDTTLRASRMRVVRAESLLFADGGVQLISPVGDAGRGQRRRVKLVCEHLEYDASVREARLSGGAVYEDPAGTVEARRMTVRLLRDGGLDSLDAAEQVQLRVQGDLGKADRLEWRGGADGVVTLVGEQALAQLESPVQGVLKATRIRYDLKSREGFSETGGGRGVIEGRPPAGHGAEPRPPGEDRP